MGSRPDHDEWLAFGLDVTLVDPDDRQRIERDRRGIYRPTWRTPDAEQEDSDAPLVMIVHAESPPCPRCRAVVHPVRADSPLWGTLDHGDELVLLVENRVAGAVRVNWIAAMGRGLVNGQLREFIRWSNNGRPPNL
jgi:hypothetical protein